MPDSPNSVWFGGFIFDFEPNPEKIMAKIGETELVLDYYGIDSFLIDYETISSIEGIINHIECKQDFVILLDYLNHYLGKYFVQFSLETEETITEGTLDIYYDGVLYVSIPVKYYDTWDDAMDDFFCCAMVPDELRAIKSSCCLIYDGEAPTAELQDNPVYFEDAGVHVVALSMYETGIMDTEYINGFIQDEQGNMLSAIGAEFGRIDIVKTNWTEVVDELTNMGFSCTAADIAAKCVSWEDYFGSALTFTALTVSVAMESEVPEGSTITIVYGEAPNFTTLFEKLPITKMQ